MTVRTDLAELVSAHVCGALGIPKAPVDADDLLLADAVLAYLGNLDGSADGALVAWHLKNDRAEIARLRTAAPAVDTAPPAQVGAVLEDEEARCLGDPAAPSASGGDTPRNDVSPPTKEEGS